MNVSNNGINLIKKWEGEPHLTAWRFNNEKYLSIGYGHTGSDVTPGMTITLDQAEELLRKDVQKSVDHVNNVNDKYNYQFNQNEFDALVSFTYNIGSINQLTQNGTRSKSVIAEKILLYTKSGGKELPGLVKRRKEEHELFLTKTSTGVVVNLDVIKLGSRGIQVKRLQIMLRNDGYVGADGKVLTIDGIAGTNTIYALRCFQEKNLLTVDGKCGQITWNKILRG